MTDWIDPGQPTHRLGYSTTSWVPSRKISAGALVAGACAVLFWMATTLWWDLTSPLASALTGLVALGAAYLVSERPAPPGRHRPAQRDVWSE